MPGKYTGKYKCKNTFNTNFSTNKNVIAMMPAVFLFALLLTLPVKGEEILNLSKLEKKAPEYTIKRDIFSPDPMRPIRNRGPVQPLVEEPPPVEKIPEKTVAQEQKDMEDEVRRSLSFEGYVIKESRNYALVSASGEFFAVAVDDIVLDRIRILKITNEAITVEIDSNRLEIQLKGDDANE
ncbi:MAG: hypothetical protein GY940_00235 [bacterium]|nr:hypothetical protein [bacterium]